MKFHVENEISEANINNNDYSFYIKMFEVSIYIRHNLENSLLKFFKESVRSFSSKVTLIK